MKHDHERHRWIAGTTMIVGLVVSVASLVYGLWAEQPMRVIFGAVMIPFFGYLAWRVIQPGRKRKRASADERTMCLSYTAASDGFWFLLAVLLIQNAWVILPGEFVVSVALLIGTAGMGLSFFYRRWRADGVSNRVKEYRTETGRTHEELARAVGVKPKTIRSIEQERYEPSISLACELASQFDCRIEELFPASGPQ